MKEDAYSETPLAPTPNSFILQDSAGTTISYINTSGCLFLYGTPTTDSDLSGRTNTNLEFRNASDNIVAFFDNQGNLKLKRGIATGYANP